ncbi:cellulose-binding domain-containing protein [Lentzea sp. NPDC005914]|uniref:cellulose-binding domain-containing protein n=1 Tax=Lentzea sp. NPDC005914 TaxID=3154572 RepID=UPI0034106E9C
MLRTEGVDGSPAHRDRNPGDAGETRPVGAEVPEHCATTTTVRPRPTCAVAYQINSQWPGAFQAEVTVSNVSGAVVDGWTLRWRFADGQTVRQMWSATSSQNGADVAVTNAGYTALIVPDGSVSLGFNGVVKGANSRPTSFTLNGAACTTE